MKIWNKKNKKNKNKQNQITAPAPADAAKKIELTDKELKQICLFFIDAVKNEPSDQQAKLAKQQTIDFVKTFSNQEVDLKIKDNVNAFVNEILDGIKIEKQERLIGLKEFSLTNEDDPNNGDDVLPISIMEKQNG